MKPIRYCKECFMPSTRPRMILDSGGVCNGCLYNKNRKQNTDWNTLREDLARIVEQSKTPKSNTTYDCVIGWSGGKDSSAVALTLRNEMGLNPLLVTFAPLIPTPEGEDNRRNLLDIGFDSILISPDGRISRYLSRRFLSERGDPKIHWNAGINSATINIASALNIPIIFYSEHGESEYGGRVLNSESTRERDLDEILENQIGDDPRNWQDDVAGIRNLDLYIIDESKLANVRILYFAHFFPWDIVSNLELVEKSIPFKRNHRGRTYGTFTDFDSLDDVMDDLYYYMQFIKFGFGRCLRDCARQIQRGRMTRNEAFEKIMAFDGEYPEESIHKITNYLNLGVDQLHEIIDSHRRQDVWENHETEWKLRFPLTTSDFE